MPAGSETAGRLRVVALAGLLLLDAGGGGDRGCRGRGRRAGHARAGALRACENQRASEPRRHGDPGRVPAEITFSTDLSWSWQGPTRAGEPPPFEARAAYVDRSQGWPLLEPIGIYAL